ncbi:metallophosphoesterase family protein [Bremerella sp. T1]|uniref:metallophosphoesterase family protein n=1 Tax=Bremerella sp. TYQ1 TaxID=3119568 RepID=UPI001CCC9B46|nr:metallophosphoesterase [Bremerella volcania]UBM34845.1 metallophosphoesterase [Bremerella volcania]
MSLTSSSLARRRFLQAGGALAGASLFPWNQSLVQAEDATAATPSFRFVHLTDIHAQPELGAAEGWLQCVQKVNQLDPIPDFVITGGDLIMDALAPDAERIDLEWKLFDEASKQLAVPVHHTIGNHDIGGWSPKSKLSKQDPRYGKAMFADRYGQGSTYHSFDHKGWHFVILDSVGKAEPGEPGSGYIGLIDDEQVEWLRNDMEKTGRDTPTVIVTHIPFFSAVLQSMSGPQTPVSRGGLVTNAHEVRKLLEPYNVQLVLSGHGHVRERIDLRGVTYLQGGAVSGGWWRGPLFHEEEAFVVVDCQPGQFDYHFHDYGWDVRKS